MDGRRCTSTVRNEVDEGLMLARRGAVAQVVHLATPVFVFVLLLLVYFGVLGTGQQVYKYIFFNVQPCKCSNET